MIFIFIKSVFLAIISFGRPLALQNAKYISLNKETTLNDLNTIELSYF